MLRILAAPAEDSGSVPNTHKVAQNHSYLQFQGIPHPLLTCTLYARSTRTHKQAEAIIHIKVKYIFYFKDRVSLCGPGWPEPTEIHLHLLQTEIKSWHHYTHQNPQKK